MRVWLLFHICDKDLFPRVVYIVVTDGIFFATCPLYTADPHNIHVHSLHLSEWYKLLAFHVHILIGSRFSATVLIVACLRHERPWVLLPCRISVFDNCDQYWYSLCNYLPHCFILENYWLVTWQLIFTDTIFLFNFPTFISRQCFVMFSIKLLTKYGRLCWLSVNKMTYAAQKTWMSSEKFCYHWKSQQRVWVEK